MILKNTIVTFTVTIPWVELDPSLGLERARTILKFEATNQLTYNKDYEVKINDCPDYPALCN